MTAKRVDFLAPVSRLLISLIFILSGLAKIPGWSQTEAMMADRGIPYVGFFLSMAILVEFVCGVLILAGNRTRLAASVLVAYLVPVTLLFHDYWNFEGSERMLQNIMFLKNLSILGGLLGVVVHGAGAYSIDALREDVRAREGKAPESRIPVEEPRRAA